MKILESKRTYLRAFTILDVEAIFEYRSLNQIAQYQYWYPYTRAQTLEFIIQNDDPDLNILEKWNGFAIINKENNLLIGNCTTSINEEYAEIDCNISPLYQNKDFAKETLLVLINYCFCKHDVIFPVWNTTIS